MSSPKWTCEAGEIIGWTEDGVSHASGIQYAQAERYALPIPTPPSTTPIQATTPCPACPQIPDRFSIALGGDAMEGMQRSEDCLRLSVHVPAGEFTGISRYRQWPSELGTTGSIEALKWVHRNITAFGGSNTNVTVFGHSAGADAAAHLMIAKGAEGLFHRAIIQSAPFGVLKDRQKMQTAMKEAGRGLTRETPIDEVITRTQVVLEKSRGFGNGSYMPFGIQYGVHPLPDESEVNAAFIKVAPKFEILLGMTEREVAIFGLLFPMLYNALKYPILSSISEKVIVKPLTKKIYGGVRDFARQHAKAGGKTYQYLFTSTSTDKHVNAGHSAEIPLLFGSKDYYKESRLVAGISWSLLVEQGKQVKRIWADFARNGSISTYKIPDCLVIEEVKS